MDASFDLPDSTDWLSTSLPTFEPLEAALRCEVCKEFYSNPVITSCSHTFCSICIRRCITADGKCPSCKASCPSDKLAPNIAVRQVVLRFQEARPRALELARAGKEEGATTSKVAKRKLEDTDLEEGEKTRQTRSRRVQSRNIRSKEEDEDTPIVIVDSEDDDGDEEFLPEGMAKCPICSKQMKAEQVYNHLDVCPGQNLSQGRSPRSRNKTGFPVTLQRRQREPSSPPVRLSQLNYAMLKEGALRKKLQDLGIPSWGSKDLMKRRHVEWLNIYNSNCDADDSVRKSKRQLLKELDEWEQTQGGKADSKENKIMRKDFDGSGYAKSHKSDFDDLIARALQKRTVPKANESKGGGEGEDGNKPEANSIQPNTKPRDITQDEAQSTHVSVSNGPMATSHQLLDVPESGALFNSILSVHSSEAMDDITPPPSIDTKVQQTTPGAAGTLNLDSKNSIEHAGQHNQADITNTYNPVDSPS